MSALGWVRLGAGAFAAVTAYVEFRPAGATFESSLSVVGALVWSGLALVALLWLFAEVSEFRERRRRR